MERENVFEVLENAVMSGSASEREKQEMFRNIMRLKNQKLNIMVTGATGCGKSSTINALFDTEVAKVGVGVDPETMEIEKYDLDNLVLWDTPGLGDGEDADKKHKTRIINKLKEKDSNGDALIDMVLVILDGSSKDLGTSYELINNVIIPMFGTENANRILVAINQADMAMKGRNWDYEKSEPNQQLKDFLEEKAQSVKRRIYEATGVTIEPVYYCAGYKEDGGEQCRPYNMSKLLYYIVQATPKEKRAVYITTVNPDEEVFVRGEDAGGYMRRIERDVWGSLAEGAMKGTEVGSKIGGALFGAVGAKVGGWIGAAVGGIGGFLGGLLGW